MKAKVSFLAKFMAVAAMLFVTSTLVFADGEITEVFLTGTSSNTAAGNFVVQTTDDIFYYNGDEYNVYKVYYDNPDMNMKVAVFEEGKCRSYIAYTKDYMFFYNCTKNGFGVRKVMFSNPDEHSQFDPEAYQEQTILSKERKMERKDAVGLIACYVPDLRK